ncbi:MAG: endolytic transglycosylase MltG [Thermoanaerobaculia bacterium]
MIGRRILRLLLLVLLLALVVVAYLSYRLEHPAGRENADEVTVVFETGTPTSQIFRRLEKEGVVEDARLVEIYYRVHRRATLLQAGEYRFTRPMAIDDVINRMGRGDVVKHVIVVPEGLTAEETFELFWKRGIGGPEAFRAAMRSTELLPGVTTGTSDLEGFLFPETYVVTRSTSAGQIVDQMVAQFRKNFSPEMRDQAQELGMTVRQAVTLASIVEKESGLPQEGRLIAGVYVNRLRHGMRLQADPTIVYAMKQDGNWRGVLYRSDYAYESPYNTYLHAGLPPGPICNPGRNALRAAVTPARTDYLYFVADQNGQHTFSRTYEEHRDAIGAARRARGEPAPDSSPVPPVPPAPAPAGEPAPVSAN